MSRPSVNSEYEVIIDNYTAEGKGVCRILSYPVFVPYTAKGDKVVVKVIKDKKTYFEGEIVTVLEPSGVRVTPNCEYFGECGGCDIMHLNYEEQLCLKKNTVQNGIKRIARESNLVINDVIGMEEPFNYRNKAVFNYDRQDGKIVSGYYKKRTNDTLEINKCNIVHKVINEVKIEVDKFCNEVNFMPKKLAIKYSFNENELMVCLVVDKRRFVYKDLLIKQLEKFDSLKSVIINFEDKDSVLFGDKSDVIYGDEYITESIDGLKFKNYLKSFFQVNPVQTKKLYSKAISLLDIQKEDLIIDLYCGVGTISMLCADKAKEVIGIEIVEDAITSAKVNANVNGFENCKFIKGDASNLLDYIDKDNQNNVKVVVDPPRKGLDKKTIHSILCIQPGVIVYISCDEGTLARDLKLFSELGYVSDEINPVDMFCNCAHIENVLKLEKRK